MKQNELQILISEIVKETISEYRKRNLKESISPKIQAKIDKWIEELGVRTAGYKIISTILQKYYGFSAEDLSDTIILANGLDAIEDALEAKDYLSALKLAGKTSEKMMEDEMGTSIYN